ncbi:MAG: thiamine pyrophosphate-binding protein [Clostridia bacterium]
MRAASALLNTLAAHGIDRMFGLPGTTEAPLLDALLHGPAIHYVLGLHESAVVAMADGYARARGGPAVANLHTTVGTGNALTGLFNALRDGSPVLALATHKHSQILTRDGFCVGPDLAEWARPVTKWAMTGTRPDQVGEQVARGLKVATADPAGPVFLAYPEDVLGSEISGDGGVGPPSPTLVAARPPDAAVAEVARAIFAAKRPVIIAGDEVSRTRAWDVLEAVAERCRIPVFQEQGRSAVFWNISTKSPVYAGVYRSGDPRVAGADLILALGPRLSVEFQPVDHPDVPPGARLIHVHRDPWELGKLYPAAMALRASAAEFLHALSGWLDEHPQGWKPFPPLERRVRGREVWEVAGRPTVAAVLAALAEAAPPHPVLVDEAVRSSPTVIDLSPLEPEGYFHSSGGGLGWGIPCAMGIKLAWPDRPVVAVVGDGSLYFGIQALWTAARERIGVKILVLNNEKYLAVEAGLNTYRGGVHPEQGYLGVDLTDPAPDPGHIAAGFGVPAQRVERGDDLRRALTWAFNRDGPALVDVRVADDPGR